MRNCRPKLPVFLFLFAVFANHASVALAIDGLSQEKRPESWKANAAITDIFFLDRQRGWAVGSHGLLLRTEDGGQTWSSGSLSKQSQPRQPKHSLTEKLYGVSSKQQMSRVAVTTESSSFSCRFESVCFKDAKNGWAAGGYDLPRMNHSRAVVARTLDGGKSWYSLPQQSIPRIHRIEFSGATSDLTGWAIGAADPGTNAAVYFTGNAGIIWSSQKTKPMPNLIDAELAGERYVGIDDRGRIVRFDMQRSEYAVISSEHEHVFCDIEIENAQSGFAVGSDGAVVKTGDGGLSWTPMIKSTSFRTFDFRCVHVSADRIWFAGDPGNVIFSFDRQSGTVSSHPLNQGAAINRIVFVDETHGWAAGDFGQIFATSDGGKNWTLQRNGSRRGNSHIGVMSVCESADELPIELIARYAGEGGKMLGVAMVQPRNQHSDSLVGVDAIRLAAERVGASGVTSIAIAPSLSQEQRHEMKLAKVVRTMRLWKPKVIVGHDRKFLIKAMELAASRHAFPQQLESGLQVWQPDYLMVADPAGNLDFDADIFLPRMGKLLEDFSLPSRCICNREIQVSTRHSYHVSQCVARGNRFDFVRTGDHPLLNSGLVQRKQRSIPLTNFNAVRSIGQKRQQMRSLLSLPDDSVVARERCKQAIAQLTFGIDTDRSGGSAAGLWLIQLADHFNRAGKTEQAAWALEHLTQSMPEHCFAPLANVTLARYFASSERNQVALNQWKEIRTNIGQANRIPGTINGSQQIAVAQRKLADGSQEYRWTAVDLATALEELADEPLAIDVEEELKDFDPATVDLNLDVETPVTETPAADQATRSKPILAMNAIETEQFLKNRIRTAASYYSRLAQRDPGLAKRADCRYVQAHIVKQLDSSKDASHYFSKVLKSKSSGTFSSAALAETSSKSNTNALPVVLTIERPHLDGLPNDDVWKKALTENQTVRISRHAEPSQDIVLLAHDREYVYLYARCYHSAASATQSSADESRVRDADLSRRDRIEMSFDIDRDLVSQWTIAVDHDGQVRESCGSVIQWNPTVYVANHKDDRTWSIECAIQKSDLSTNATTGERWRFRVKRNDGDRDASNDEFWAFDVDTAGTMIEFR